MGHLEYELSRHLHDAGGVRDGNLAELRAVPHCHGCSPQESSHATDTGAEAIGQVEGFSTDFHSLALTHSEDPRERGIDLPGGRSGNARPPQVSKRTEGNRRGKCIPIEPGLAGRRGAARSRGIGGERIRQQ